jgi:hypothetical protein
LLAEDAFLIDEQRAAVEEGEAEIAPGNLLTLDGLVRSPDECHAPSALATAR